MNKENLLICTVLDTFIAIFFKIILVFERYVVNCQIMQGSLVVQGLTCNERIAGAGGQSSHC